MARFALVEDKPAAECSPVMNDRAAARLVPLEDNGVATECSSVEDDGRVETSLLTTSRVSWHSRLLLSGKIA